MDNLLWRPSKRRRNFYDSSSSSSESESESDSESDTYSDGEHSVIMECGPIRRSSKTGLSTSDLQTSTLTGEVPSLTDIAVKVVAKHVSCAEIENHDPPLDESMLKKIAFWAFPQDESHVKVFAQLTLRSSFDWDSGERANVYKIRQVGFMVSALVGGSVSKEKQEAKVSLTFEKHHLTSTSCSICPDVVFCQHIIAVILERIKNAKQVPLHAPVTETLSTLTRDQLQKLLQYAINEDPGGVLGRVFQHIDEIRDTSSEYNKLPGAPDPTFGILPDEKSTWDLSLETLQKRLSTDLGDGFNSYKDTCDLISKSKTGFYASYFKRLTDLIRKDEVEAAGKILIIIAETTFSVSNFRWSNSAKRVFLDVERMFSCFVACFTGQIRQDVIKAALNINRSVKSDTAPVPSFLRPWQWSEMLAIKLHGIGDDNLEVVRAMGGQEDKPFYEPLIASQIPATPDALLACYDKNDTIIETTYNEPLDVMLFRFECLVQYYLWKDDESCPYKMCVLGSLILKKLLALSENYSILTFDEKRCKVIQEIEENDEEMMDVQEEETDEPSAPKKTRRSRGNTTKQKKDNRTINVKINDAIDEIQRQMWRSTDNKTFDGLSEAQLCYSMLYISFTIWKTRLATSLDATMLKILIEASVRVMELSRFTYFRPMGSKEALWWEQLIDSVKGSLQGFLSFHCFEETMQKYSQALLRSELSFYDRFLPLSLIDLLQTSDLPSKDQLQLAVKILCYSEEPVYKFESLQTNQGSLSVTGLQADKMQLKINVIKTYKTLLSRVFAVNCELLEKSEAARQVLKHLELVKDGEYVVIAYNCIKLNLENIVEKEDKLVLLTVMLNCVKECVLHNGQNGLFSHSTSVSETLLFLSKSLSEEFPRHVLPIWTEMCKYFNNYQIKLFLQVIRQSVIEQPSLIQDMASIVQKYFTSSFKHDRECCHLLRIFFPDDAKRHKILKKIAANSTNYTSGALLRIGKTEYKILSKSDPTLNIFSKQVYNFFMLGLKKLKDSSDNTIHIVTGYSNLHLNSQETKYLKWYFGMLAACLSKEIIKGEQFTKLMSILKVVLKQDVNLMLNFYQEMEVSLIGLKETKAHLGRELVSCFLHKFNSELRNCNHTHYVKVLEEMKTASKDCELYVPNGSKEFGTVVLSFIRHTYKGKRKLIQLMDEFFPDYVKSKKTKTDKMNKS